MGMSWVFLALVSATCKAGHQVLQKRLIEKVGVLELSLIGQLAAALMIFPLALVPNSVTIPEDAAFHAAAWISIVLNVVAILLLLEAIRVGELSYALPFLALTPLFCIATGWILRGEQVTLAGTVGILVLLGGAFALGANSLRDFVRLGGHRVFHDKGVRLVILVAAIYAVSSVYDKTATVLSSPLSYVWYLLVWRAALLVFLFVALRRPLEISARVKGLTANRAITYFVLGGLFMFEALFQMFALQTGMVYVLAIKRVSILLTSVSGLVFFGEKFPPFRIAGVLAMVSGAALIYIEAGEISYP